MHQEDGITWKIHGNPLFQNLKGNKIQTRPWETPNRSKHLFTSCPNLPKTAHLIPDKLDTITLAVQVARWSVWSRISAPCASAAPSTWVGATFQLDLLPHRGNSTKQPWAGLNTTKLVDLGYHKGWHQCIRKMETHGKSMKIHRFKFWFFPFKSLYVKVAENAFFGFIRTHPTSDSRMSRKHTKNWWTHWKTMRNMKNSLNSMKIQRRTQQEHETRTACHIFRILLTIKYKHDPEKL